MFDSMLKMRNKLIIVMMSFSAAVIILVITLLYLNLKLKVNDFNKTLIDVNQNIVMEMLNKSKTSGKEIILTSNNKVVAHTKDKINTFIKKASKEQNISLLKTAALSMDLEIKSAEALLMNTADSPAFYWQYDVKEKEVLNNIMAKNNYFSGFVVFFETGETLLKVGDAPDRIDSKRVFNATKNKEIYYSPLDRGANFYIAVPIVNENGKYRGALVAKIKLKRLTDYVFEKIDLGVDKTIFIMDYSKVIIKHKNKEFENRSFRESQMSFKADFQQILNNRDSVIYNIYKYDGDIKFFIVIQEYIADSFSYIDTLKGEAEETINNSFIDFDNSLKKEIRTSYNKTKKETEDQLERFAKEILGIIYFIIIIAIVISVIIGIILANYITNPIKELSVAAKRIGDGNLDYVMKKELIEKHDEIGTLAREFSVMQTKLKLGIDHIRELERKKAHSERLSIVGQMVSGIVHEIKNPLTSISGFAQIINELSEDKMIKSNSKVIIDETDRLNKLTLEMLDFAKPAKLDITEIDVRELLKNKIEVLAPKAKEKNIKMELDVAHNLPNIQGDKNKLTQVFINIMSNAIEAINKPDGVINISSERTGEQVILFFRDNGPGIPKNIREKLFMPFVSGKKSGTGLGLAMVKKIIDDHMGEITVETSDGGTQFIIKLYINIKIEE